MQATSMKTVSYFLLRLMLTGTVCGPEFGWNTPSTLMSPTVHPA
jgi:hypothetical protein